MQYMIDTEFYRITPYSNLLHIENFLSWDERVVKKVLDDVAKTVQSFYQDKQWGILSDRVAWELATPEADGLFSKNVPNVFNDTLTHIAIDIGKSEIKKWQLAHMTKSLYQQYETKLFETIEEAEQWLSSFGYKRENQILI